MNQPDGIARSSDLSSASLFSVGRVLCNVCGLSLPPGMEGVSFCNSFDLSPATLTFLRVCEFMAYLRREGHTKNFSLSAQGLFETTLRLDIVSYTKMGFGYSTRLRFECNELVPNCITETSANDELLSPLVRWRLNRPFFLCGGLGTSLLLALIHRLIRWDGTLADADFSKLAIDMMECPLGTLPAAFQENVAALLKNREA